MVALRGLDDDGLLAEDRQHAARLDEDAAERPAGFGESRSVVFSRTRKASSFTTTTAMLSGPVEIRSRGVTGVPTIAARPFTVARALELVDSLGDGQVALGERPAHEAGKPSGAQGAGGGQAGDEAAAVAAKPIVVVEAHGVPSGAVVRLRKITSHESWPRRRPRLSNLVSGRAAGRTAKPPCGFSRAGHGRQRGEDVLGVLLPVRGGVEVTPGRQAGGEQLREGGLQEAPLVVALLGPGVRKEHVDAGQAPRREHLADDFDSVVLDRFVCL